MELLSQPSTTFGGSRNTNPRVASDLDGFTIAQFSDLHASLTIERNFIQSVVEQVNKLKADVIVFTGDLVDGTVPDLRSDIAPLKELHAHTRRLLCYR